ncbi:plasmodesmata-located protein 6 [Juglans microcarpa x Juglans regia]|uniref:plasmodesmata-located protein 6 n=1 Tax=Juglans microcarpa x Juglans regia TaxID=2249226 RepID=UPI001B7E3FFE|nr:plasmodesmata-located protein 6 [Juglans microcarpa x Juglans regia]
MSVSNKAVSLLSLSGFLLTISTLTTPSDSAIDTFVFGGCSQLKYTPGSPYENSANSILTSLVNSAMFTTYNNFTTTGSTQQDTVYGLFQCRGDLQDSDCARCVARSVSQLGTLCVNSCGGALQLEGCYVKYDNTTFLGVEDKTVIVKKCGAPTIGYDSDALTRRDAVLAYLGTGDGGAYKTFRSSTSGDLQGVAQCVGDLSAGECQDCLTDAIGRLKTECGTAAWGDMFLAKCYVRYTEGGVRSHAGEDYDNGNDKDNDDDDDDEWNRTLAIIIGGVAAVGLLIIFLSFLNKHFEKGCK